MSLHSTNLSSFVQSNPRTICPSQAYLKSRQEWEGLPYLPKCRDPRHTLACRANWAFKADCISERRLTDIVDDDEDNLITIVRGNLSLPPGASPDDHRRVRERFTLALRRWKGRERRIMDILATIHASPKGAHYDFVGFHDGPAKRAWGTLRGYWLQSGGLRATCRPMKRDEIAPVVKYQVKESCPMNVMETTDSNPPQIEPIYLLRSRSEIGLGMQWSTSGFWGDTSPDAIWETLKAEWFPTPEDLDKEELHYAFRCFAKGHDVQVLNRPEVFHQDTPEEREAKLRAIVLRMVS